MDITKAIKDLRERVEKLELAVLVKSPKGKPRPEARNFTGATGGLRLLVSKGFFDKKRAFGEITSALTGLEYHYSRQAVQTPLNKLSRPGGPLVSLREGGKKVYAKRK